MVLLFPPIWHDLALGNVSVFTVAVLAVLLSRRDGVGGVAFGLLLLLAPKPHLLPLALWLLVRRPRDGVAALATLGVGVVAGMAVFGIDRWVEWIATFREPLERTFTANVGFSGLLGPAGVVVGVAVAVVVGAAALLRRGDIGMALALVSGIVLGPYTFIHYLSGLVVVVDPVLRSRPRWLAPYPWLLIVFPLIPAWLSALAWTMWRTPDVEAGGSRQQQRQVDGGTRGGPRALGGGGRGHPARLGISPSEHQRCAIPAPRQPVDRAQAHAGVVSAHRGQVRLRNRPARGAGRGAARRRRRHRYRTSASRAGRRTRPDR
jgi:hypothetical protein